MEHIACNRATSYKYPYLTTRPLTSEGLIEKLNHVYNNPACIYDHLYIDYSEKDGSAVDPHYAILRLMLPLIPIHQETFITVRLSM